MTPEQIKPDAKRRLQTALRKHFDDDQQYMSALADALDAIEDLLPAGGIRYAVAHPVTGISDPRFVGYTLEECKQFATEYDTHVIEQHLTEWSRHE
ncbi:hypothetical protein [Rhodococcus sp. (in: high G+C Gram-positive bacteria)]|uniref:hypothetical protein n=1 Tax=Rhodococcus sp. TaxID=1831 RepID=UPI001A33BC8B|nr:hypothetical protein [Rhodococcus sp. (in: high G+C Gram-positive bacteria)]MBJ7479247.1 hypothetical protein [Rhodococcus sp. (in: high G+C Gram-positive bacteria)]